MTKEQQRRKAADVRYKRINAGLIIAEGVAFIGILIYLSRADSDTELAIGMCMFPLSGLLLITPVLIRSALRDYRNWRRIYTGQGLPEDRDAGFYTIKDPGDLRRKLFRKVFWEQYRNAFAGFFILMAVLALNIVIFEHGVMSRFIGRAVIIILIVLVLGMPYLIYLFVNSILRLKVLMDMEYHVYHAVVQKVDFRDMFFCCKDRLYRFSYCACVGIRPDDVKDTPAVLVFLPDEVYLIPDKADTAVL